MNAIAKGEKSVKDIREWYAQDRKKFDKGYHMHFITNHDENSWAGTIEERLGKAAKTMAVLAFTFDGMPLIYGGQEAGLNKRLAFFERDPVDWGTISEKQFYTTLLQLKKQNQALWNGEAGGTLQQLAADNEAIYAYYREKNGHKILAVLNLSAETQNYKFTCEDCAGNYTHVFTKSAVQVPETMLGELPAWGYTLLSFTP